MAGSGAACASATNGRSSSASWPSSGGSLWARFVVAVVAEVRTQLEERRRLASAPLASSGRVRFEPPPTRTGAGRLAQRLVAAILVLVPAGVRVAPSTATATVATAPAAAPATPDHGAPTESSSERTMPARPDGARRLADRHRRRR